jgi:hypothetical protein
LAEKKGSKGEYFNGKKEVANAARCNARAVLLQRETEWEGQGPTGKGMGDRGVVFFFL